MYSLSNELRHNTLDLLRFPLALVVVIVHVFDSEVAFNIFSFDRFYTFKSLNLIIDGFLRGISVPVYYFVSGYFFFYNVDFSKTVYVKKIKNRTHTLLVPYIIWNSIAIILVLLKQLPCFSVFHTYQGTELNINLVNILSCYIADNGQLVIRPNCENILISPYPINTALWFIRDLIIVVLATPVINYLIVKCKYYSVIVLLLLNLVVHIWIPSLGMLATAFSFFSWGAYMSINKIDFVVSFRPYFKISIAIFCILSLILMYYINAGYNPIIIYQLKAIIGLILLLNISAYLLTKGYCRVNTFLSSMSFFIYISHCLVASRMTKILIHAISPSSGCAVIVTYMLSVILTVMLLMGCYVVLRKLTPNLLTFITGRK